MISGIPADYRSSLDALVTDRVESWDAAAAIPVEVLRRLGADGLLCAQVPERYGGLGYNSMATGELTAYVGSRCSSVRSVMTSQGIAAWTIQRFADARQRAHYLSLLTSGQLAAVAFSEPEAGSDLSSITTQIHRDGDNITLTGQKVWTTAARYADLLIVLCRVDDQAAGAVVVPTSTPGVTIEPVTQPLGCRAAGHANVEFDGVRLPAASLLGDCGYAPSLLFTTALTFGRISVAWGCVGILRACLASATSHARTRRQFGKPLAEHQLIARHLAELVASEQISTRLCEHASQSWDANSASVVVDTILAKYVSARHAASGAAAAVQVLASAGARDTSVVARAYRDAKLMELIEGSNEICQLLLAEHALSVPSSNNGGPA